jgi:hypothetical protein
MCELQPSDYTAFSGSVHRQALRASVRRDLPTATLSGLDLCELYLKALGQPQELTPAERFHFERLMTYISSGFATALDYHEQGLLDDEMIETYGQGFLQVFDSPVGMEWWGREGNFSFSQTFRDLVSERKAS